MMFVKQRYAGTLLAVIAVFGLAGCDGASQAQDAPTRPQVSVMTLAGQDLVISEDLPARVAAVRSAEIRAQISGIVQRRLFEQGAEIGAGTVLFQIIRPPSRRMSTAPPQHCSGRSRADPRPAYRKEEEAGKTYAVWLLDFNVRWRVTGAGFEVFALEPR